MAHSSKEQVFEVLFQELKEGGMASEQTRKYYDFEIIISTFILFSSNSVNREITSWL